MWRATQPAPDGRSQGKCRPNRRSESGKSDERSPAIAREGSARRRFKVTETYVGLAKLQLGLDTEAVVWLRRSIDANRNYSVAHFLLAAALGLLGALDEARTAAKAGLALNPSLTIRRLRETVKSGDSPSYIAGRERIFEGMRLARLPER
jgi:hypothetical protein